MVVDTSALLAVLFMEPEAERFTRAMIAADSRLISAASYLEAAIIVDARRGPEAGRDLDEFVDRIGLSLEPVTRDQVRIARQAYGRYGRGNHPAGLNFGDCFAFALAVASGQPLLFKGADFAHTDLVPAL